MGGIVQNEALVNFNPDMEVDFYGDSCWVAIISLTVTIILV